jgi:hypothetical protein
MRSVGLAIRFDFSAESKSPDGVARFVLCNSRGDTSDGENYREKV